jgi:hypothetical protein
MSEPCEFRAKAREHAVRAKLAKSHDEWLSERRMAKSYLLLSRNAAWLRSTDGFIAAVKKRREVAGPSRLARCGGSSTRRIRANPSPEELCHFSTTTCNGGHEGRAAAARAAVIALSRLLRAMPTGRTYRSTGTRAALTAGCYSYYSIHAECPKSHVSDAPGHRHL